MHGYLRRKVTYNIGKGGIRNSNTAPRHSLGTGKFRNLNPMNWFIDSLDDDEINLYCIMEEDGRFFIDDEYRAIGESEGWLKRTGYYRDEKNRLVWTFRHIRL